MELQLKLILNMICTELCSINKTYFPLYMYLHVHIYYINTILMIKNGNLNRIFRKLPELELKLLKVAGSFQMTGIGIAQSELDPTLLPNLRNPDFSM